jgi:hypothetical protein
MSYPLHIKMSYLAAVLVTVVFAFVLGIGNVSAQAAPFTLTVTANPASGLATLNPIITAEALGHGGGLVTYRISCDGDQVWEDVGISLTNFGTNVCSYSSPGVYTVLAQAENGGQTVQATTIVTITTRATGGLYVPVLTMSVKVPSVATPQEPVDIQVDTRGGVNGSFLTYTIDCESDGVIDLKTDRGESTFQAQGLCAYKEAGQYSVQVVAEQRGATATTSAIINVEKPVQKGDFEISTQVRAQSTFAKLASAQAQETVEFQVNVLSIGEGPVENLQLKFFLPPTIQYAGPTRLNGVEVQGSIAQGINIASIPVAQELVVSFGARVAQENLLSLGQSNLIGVALVYNKEKALSDVATVSVFREELEPTLVQEQEQEQVVELPEIAITTTFLPPLGALVTAELQEEVFFAVNYRGRCDIAQESWDQVELQVERKAFQMFCEYQEPGTYTQLVQVEVQGQTKEATSQIEVTGQPLLSGFWGTELLGAAVTGINTDLFPWIFLAVLLLALFLFWGRARLWFFLLWRRRKKEQALVATT